MKVFEIAPVKYLDGKMLILDQTRLPGEEIYIEMRTKEDVYEAIYKLRVRGAPAIGVAAAYGLFVAVRDIPETADMAMFRETLHGAKEYLAGARPTAVNLAWALNRMYDLYESERPNSVKDAKELLFAEDVRRELQDEFSKMKKVLLAGIVVCLAAVGVNEMYSARDLSITAEALQLISEAQILRDNVIYMMLAGVCVFVMVFCAGVYWSYSVLLRN